MAVTALDHEQATAHRDELLALTHDTNTAVRAAVAEALGLLGRDAMPSLAELEDDESETVREAVAAAYGTVGDPAAIGWLTQAAYEDESRQVREGAVASLGSIGSPAAVDTLLDLIASGPPQVRRRAIAAVTVFEDDRIEPALRRAALDRNPGVREAAEMVVGRQIRVEGS